MASDLEIIEFQIPTCNRKNLFVTNIPAGSSETEIYVSYHIRLFKMLRLRPTVTLQRCLLIISYNPLFKHFCRGHNY